MRRAPFPLIVLTVLATLALPTAANAATTCTFDDVTGIVSIGIDGTSTSIATASDAIVVDAVPCGTATTANTDTIEVTVSAPTATITLDLSGGPFAPGDTTEFEESSEIEFEITGASFGLAIIGKSGSDLIGFGADAGAPAVGLINLNENEPVWDADVSFETASLVSADLQLGVGADSYSAHVISGGELEPITDRPITVDGGGGADAIAAHVGGVFAGGVGADTLDLNWMSDGCEATVVNGAATGVDSSVSGCASDANGTFEITSMETLVGTGGDDAFFGTTWAEEFWGVGGDDSFVPYLGDDAIKGGPGQDELIAESDTSKRFTFDLSAKTMTGQGTDSFAGVERLASTSDGADTFVGDPGKWLKFVTGGGGKNVLDLQTGSSGFQVRTQIGLDAPALDPGWIAAQGVLVLGGRFADTMVGNPGATPSGHDEFRGFGGADRLAGGGGSDDLWGGAGNDRIQGGAGNDSCNGGSGTNTISGCES